MTNDSPEVEQNPDDVMSWARWNASQRTNLLQLIIERAEKTPDDDFVFIDNQTVSYADFYRRIREWAAIYKSVGVGHGDHVVTFLLPDFDGYAIWLGLASLGAVDVPLNPAYRGPVLLHALRMADARLAVVSAPFLERIKELADEAPVFDNIIVPGIETLPDATGLPVIREAEILASAPPFDDNDLVDPQPHDIACIIFTSGTTGPAKAVLVPWGQMIAQSYLERPDQHNDDLYNMNNESVYYTFAPTFHMSGRYSLFIAIARGARIAFRPTFSVENFWNDVNRYGVTHTQLLAPMMAFLMTKPESPQDKQHSLKAVVGGPTGEVLNNFMRRYNVRVRAGFGMTEIGGPLGTPWMSHDNPPESCGVPVVGGPQFEFRIVDEHDYPVAPGDTGELLVRAADPWVLNAGYYKMPEATAEAWRNGWFHTGDLLRQDDAGEFHFVDRSKDCIRRRGENISSFEVESFVIQHPAVLEVAAIPAPSDYGRGEDEVKVCLVTKPGKEVAAIDLHSWLSERMPRYMLPRYIEIVDQLPKTEATQRIQKSTLRERGNGPDTWDSETAKE